MRGLASYYHCMARSTRVRCIEEESAGLFALCGMVGALSLCSGGMRLLTCIAGTLYIRIEE